jgi:hypothetical protein
MPYNQTKQLHSIATTMKQLLADYDTASPTFRDYQFCTLKMMCRWLEKFITPRVSVRAMKSAQARGVTITQLQETQWKNQVSKLKDPKRREFHLEHVVPVNQIAQQILEEREQPVSRLIEILQTAEIAWITKCEDKKLNEQFKSRRPNPMKAYEDCGITLVKSTESTETNGGGEP